KDAEINREGAASLDELPELPLIPAAKLSAMMDDGTPALDVRPPEEFAAGHVPGSINIGLSGQFASWAGALLGLESRPVLIADSQARIDEARMRLARVGIEELSGYLEGGVSGWTQAGFSLAHLPQITAQDLNQRRRDPGDRKSTRLNSSHVAISYAVFCLKKKNRPSNAGEQTTN